MKNRYIKPLFASILCILILTSCFHKAAEISEDAGVGRLNVPEKQQSINDNNANNGSDNTDQSGKNNQNNNSDNNDTQYTPPPLEKREDDDDKADDKITEVTYKYDGTKFVYSFPKRDDSGLATVADMSTTSTALFEDQGNDLNGSWYAGKSTYDETTKQVTYAWDRYPSTTDLVSKYNGIYRGDTSENVVYLTFDCGYEYGPTKDILDVLKEKKVAGTFFLTGAYIKSEPELVKRIVNEGHVAGNHTVNHKNMTQVSVETFIEELEGVEKLFYELIPDAHPMFFYRPPEGACNEWALKLADKMGYRTVLWSFAYKDYDVNNQPPVSEALDKCKKGLHPGCVYLLHTESTTNAALLGDLIDWIREQGYEIKPLCAIENTN